MSSDAPYWRPPSRALSMAFQTYGLEARLQTMTPIQRDSSTLARLSVSCKAQAGDESAQQQIPCRDETNGTDGKMPMAGTRNQ